MDEPTATETGTTEDVLSVYLAKYGSLRAETASRFQFQAQAYNFLVVVLTAAVVAAASLLGSGHGAQFERLILVLPLVAGPLGYLYLTNDLMIFGIAGYLDRELSRDVSALVGRDIVLTDARLDHLSPRGRATLAALGYSRWLLFVVPTVAPVVFAALATGAWRESPFSLLCRLSDRPRAAGGDLAHGARADRLAAPALASAGGRRGRPSRLTCNDRRGHRWDIATRDARSTASRPDG